MKIGFNTCGYIDSAGMPIEEVIEAAARQGYEGIDISSTRGPVDDPALFPQDDRRRYKETAEQLGLEIVCVVTHLPMINAVWKGQPINVPGAVDLARDIGSGMVAISIGSHQETGHDFDLAWESAVEHLTDVCEYAEDRGITIALDGIRPNTLLDTPQKATKMLLEVGLDNLKHCLDPCYLAWGGHEPSATVKELSPHICHVQFKDYRGTYPDFQQHITGDGKLDHKSWVSALKRAKYKGYINVDCLGTHDLKRSARVGYRTLAKCL